MHLRMGIIHAVKDMSAEQRPASSVILKIDFVNVEELKYQIKWWNDEIIGI